MAMEPATKENFERIGKLGAKFKGIFAKYAKMVADAPPELLETLEINGLNTIVGRIEEAIDRAVALEGDVKVLRKQIDRYKEAAESEHRNGKQKGR